MFKKEVLLILLFFVGILFACPDNCNDCDPSGNICFACKQNYELSVFGKCVSNIIDKCIVYGPTNQCFVCQPSFELSGRICVKQYTGCVNKNTNDGSCYDCGFGKFLQNNICVGNINCNKSQFPCNSCVQGFDLSNGRCVDTTPGCASVRSDGLCGQCKQGFKMMGYRCIQNRVFVPYCYVYYNNGGCQRCKNGYSLFQNYCLLPVQIQAILQRKTTINQTLITLLKQTGAQTTTTTTQQNGATTTTTTTTTVIIINNNSSSSNNGSSSSQSNQSNQGTQTQTTVLNCKRLSGQQCLQCNDGYVVANGICKTIDLNCAAYQLTTGTCTACVPTFQLQNGLCVKSTPPPTPDAIANCQVVNPAKANTCLICTYGFFPSGNTCAKVSKYCDGHNVQNGNCFNCLFGLTLNNGRCVDSNCVTRAPNGEDCSVCGPNYNVNSNGVCIFVDPNCQSLKGAICDVCKPGFYVNFRGICLRLPANCRFANVQIQNTCIQCNDNFVLSSTGSCVQQTAPTVVVIPNCNNVVNNVCQSCVNGFYVQNGVCTKVSVLCSAYNLTSGACFGCITGYTLINGACYDINCLNQAQDRCVQCKNNFRVIPPSNLCTYFDPNCQVLAPNGCANCIKDFAVGASGLCERSSSSNNNNNNNNSGSNNSTVVIIVNPGNVNDSDRDPNCKQYANSKCVTCSNRYYMAADGKCIPVNPLCKDYNGQGACLTCYTGYTISGTICAAARDNDPYCKSRNTNGACVQCYTGFFLNITRCAGLNPLCKSSNLINGQCTTCYTGYSLNNGLCSVSFKDPNCQQYNNVTNACIKCSNRYYLDRITNNCSAVNVLCKGYSEINGVCTECYQGYKVSSGFCVIETASNSDLKCKRDNAQGVCLQCYNGFYLKVGKCEQISLLCKTSNSQTGVCLSCYTGYVLNAGQCRIPSTTAEQGDVNCKQFSDNAKKICGKCYDGYFVRNGVCNQFNALCNGSNPINGDCLACYQGYTLFQGNCVIYQQAVSTNGDAFCFRKQGAACLQCFSGYFLNSSGICNRVNPLCRTYVKQTGACDSCYPGYDVKNGDCAVQVAVNIPFCQTTNALGACIECIDSYFIRNGECRPVSLLCGGQYNKVTGLCTGCITGYFLQGGQCIYPSFGIDPACQRYANSFCDKCSLGFYLNNYVCTQINRFCLQFDYQKSVCTKCFNKTPQGAECV